MAAHSVADFSLPSTGGTHFHLFESLSGPGVKSLVLYFYPKDNTPGCTTEAQQFGELHARFRKAGALVCGVSRDSLKSHENFKAKMGFPFDLLSDTDEKICTVFDVIKMKNMYGRRVRGIVRSTFAIGRDRTILREWRGVKVPGHAQEVLDFVETV